MAECVKPFVYRQIESPAIPVRGSAGQAVQAQAVECFDGFLAATGRAKATRRMYAATVRLWLAAGGQPGHLDMGTLSAWLGSRRARLAPATINRELKALRRFYVAMRMLGFCVTDEHRKIPRNRRVPARIVRCYTDEQIGAVLAQPDVATFAGFRDHLIMRLLYETGLRSGELVALSTTDILPDRTVFVDRGKGGHSRYVPISGEAMALIDAYLIRRAAMRPGKRAALWLTAHGKPLRNARSIWEIVSRHARAALGLGGGYDRIRTARRSAPWSGHYPHRLRASFATALLARGCPITVIAQLLGHADIATTQHYLSVDLAHLKTAIAHHPRALRKAASPGATSSSLPSATLTNGPDFLGKTE